MRSLSCNDIIDIWEAGQDQHYLDRALTILSRGCPDMTWKQLSLLNIGLRDKYLIDLREKTFGAAFKGYAECSKCNEKLEFTVSSDDLSIRPEPAGKKEESPMELIADNMKLVFRLPDSTDLAAAVCCKDTRIARELIARRCVLKTTSDGKEIKGTKVKRLPAKVIRKLADFMEELDPQAEMLFDMKCPACGHKWKTVFDILTFLWKEISLQAGRLLREVHILASAYGWREEDILSMSSVRRQAYMDMVI